MNISNEVVFKKRIIKGNIRKKESDSNQNDLNDNLHDDNDSKDELDKHILEDVKLQQTMRNRKSGSSLLILTNKNNKNTNLNEDDQVKTIESVMGTQYTSQIDYGIDNNNTIPHKKLMDEYINERLGISNQTK